MEIIFGGKFFESSSAFGVVSEARSSLFERKKLCNFQRTWLIYMVPVKAEEKRKFWKTIA